MNSWGILGVPSSAAAHWPGQEKAPEALRAAGLLNLPGTVDGIAGLGPRQPLLRADRVCFFGYAEDEEDVHGLVPGPRYPASLVAAAPAQEAELALAELTRTTPEFVVHFDVDVLDFFTMPAADVPQHGRGLDLEAVVSALRVFVRHPGFRGMTVCEFNPDHAEPDTAGRLVEGLVSALA